LHFDQADGSKKFYQRFFGYRCGQTTDVDGIICFGHFLEFWAAVLIVPKPTAAATFTVRVAILHLMIFRSTGEALLDDALIQRRRIELLDRRILVRHAQ